MFTEMLWDQIPAAISLNPKDHKLGKDFVFFYNLTIVTFTRLKGVDGGTQKIVAMDSWQDGMVELRVSL